MYNNTTEYFIPFTSGLIVGILAMIMFFSVYIADQHDSLTKIQREAVNKGYAKEITDINNKKIIIWKD